MKQTSRRGFLKSSLAAGVAFGWPRIVAAGDPPSETVRVAVIGMGDTQAVGGVGGRGHQLIPRLREVPGAKIVALCDVDSAFLEREAQEFKNRGEAVATHRDLRRVLEDKNIDAVVVALPNHWHALATVWACQAGKDVYVEKPFAHDIWEGRQAVAAARKYGRMVQVGTQNRSSQLLRRTFEKLRGGELGPMRFAHALVYRGREGIGTVGGPTPVAATVNYDLWCGPAPLQPLRRKQLNYEWHWFWSTGNGEMGNNGVHVLDLCRLALGQNGPPPRVMSIGGRFAFHDGGETANTQIALLDYHPVPVICEVRNVQAARGPNALGTFRHRTQGLVIDCAGGYFAGDATGGGFFERKGKKIKDIPEEASDAENVTSHLANFIGAVRSRKAGDLMAEALEGHFSATCCHMANISHRIGGETPPEAIVESIRSSKELADAFARCREYLRNNGVDLNVTPARLGPWVTLDPERERFVHGFADQANALLQREYRAPYVVPKLA
jgi:predicted dehydrogenase